MTAKMHASLLESPGSSTRLVEATQVPAVQARISLAMAKAAAVNREANAAELPPMVTCAVATQTDAPSTASVSICPIFA